MLIPVPLWRPRKGLETTGALAEKIQENVKDQPETKIKKRNWQNFWENIEKMQIETSTLLTTFLFLSYDIFNRFILFISENKDSKIL